MKPQNQNQDNNYNNEAKKKEFIKGKGRHKRNQSRQVWNATKDMRVFIPNKGRRDQVEKEIATQTTNSF